MGRRRRCGAANGFGQVDDQGRELDVHLVRLADDGPPAAVCDVPWRFDEGSLAATGVLDGCPVSCVSATTQIQMHTGLTYRDTTKSTSTA